MKKLFISLSLGVMAISASATVDIQFSIIAPRTDCAFEQQADDHGFTYISNGTPLIYDEDGNLVGGDYGNTIFGIEPFDLPEKGSYVLAFDYKVDTPIFTWINARRTWDDGTTISTEERINIPLTPASEFQTYYIPLIDTNVWDWHAESWADGNTRLTPYLILDQDSNGKQGPFELIVKNGRILPTEEAITDFNTNTKGAQPEGIYNFHGLMKDYDEVEEADYFYIPEAGLAEGEQAIIGTESRIYPIAPQNTNFTFEYNSSDSFTMHVMVVNERSEWYAKPVGDITIEGRDDFGMDLADPANWTTATIDLSAAQKEDGLGQGFGSRTYLWIQCYEAPDFAMFYIKDARWTQGSSAIQSVLNEENGEAKYYNIQGMQISNPSNGLYIKVQNGKSTKHIAK